MAINFEELLAGDDEEFRDVPVPRWGGDVRLRRLELHDWIHFADKLKDYELDADGFFVQRAQLIDFGVELLAKTIVGEDGRLPLDNDAGRRRLQRDPFVLVQLLRESMDLSCLAGDVHDALTRAKKN